MVMSMCEIKATGYGLIPRKVMLDKSLSYISRYIYAYFCSISGNKGSSYPSFAKIIGDLGINKKTFLKYLKPLQEKKYIELKRQKFHKTIYQVFLVDGNNDSCVDHDVDHVNDHVGYQMVHSKIKDNNVDRQMVHDGNNEAYDVDHVNDNSEPFDTPNRGISSYTTSSERTSSYTTTYPTISNSNISSNIISNNNKSNNINRGDIEEEVESSQAPQKMNYEIRGTNLKHSHDDVKNMAGERTTENKAIKEEITEASSKTTAYDDKLVLLISNKDKETLKEFMARCDLSNELFENMYQYIINRNLRKKTMTYGALRLLIANLKKIAPSIEAQRDILNQSTINGWNNVFPINEPPSSAQPPYAFGGRSRHGGVSQPASRAFLLDENGNCPLAEEKRKEERIIWKEFFERIKAKEAAKAEKKAKSDKKNKNLNEKMKELVLC